MTFSITLTPSGHSFGASGDRNLLQSGLEAGFALPYSCRTGNCKTCKGRIVSGTVDHGTSSLAFLPAAERELGNALLCQARPRSDLVVEVAEVSGLANIRPRIMPCRVVRLERPAPDIAIMEVRLPPNEAMRFVAGQYVEVILEGDKRRPYSIANQPKGEGVIKLELHLRHSPGGLFTDRVFSSLKERDLLKIEGPLGTFVLREESANPIVMVASGTGFAPIKAMLEYAFQKGLTGTRPIALYWGARVREHLYLLDVPERWSREQPNFTFVPVLSDPTADCAWQGRTGLVHRAVMDDHPDLSQFEVYACGAPVMVEAAKHDFQSQCGLPASMFFADEFITEAERHAPILQA